MPGAMAGLQEGLGLQECLGCGLGGGFMDVASPSGWFVFVKLLNEF